MSDTNENCTYGYDYENKCLLIFKFGKRNDV